MEFGHDGFEARIATTRESIAFSHAAENVAYNQGYADPAQQGGYYLTQIFIQLPPNER